MKDTLYDVRGRHSFKLNYSPSKDWSVIGFAEIAETGEMGSTEFEAEEAFGKKAVLKAEKNFSGGAHTLGFVAGLRERHGGWFGSYGSAEVLDGLTLFGDLGAEVGSANWYPVFDKQTGLTTLSQIYRNSGRVSTSSVLGARYSFTGGTDFRVEWIFQELGYTASQIETIYDAASSRSPIQQAKNIELLPRLIKSGLELPGRQYLMASLRIPDVFEFQKTLVYSRILFSPRDYSATAYLTVEIPVSSYGTSFVELYQSFGENQSELKGFVGSSFLAGYRQYF